MGIVDDPLYQYVQQTQNAQGGGTKLPDFLGSRQKSRPIYPNQTYARGEYIPQWGNTQDVAKEFNWGGGQDMYAAMAAGEAEMAANDAYDKWLQDIYDRLGGSDSTDGGSGSSGGYNMQAMVNQINDSFARQQQALDQARAAGQAGVQGAYDMFAGNIGRNYADYTGATNQAQAAMAQRVAQQIAEAQARQAELQRSAQSMGMDYGALTQQQAGNLGALQAASSFQQDLGQRLAQVVANNQRALQGSGELVRQGAMGNLESNYQALLGALQSAREQQLMQAQSAAYSGGGGGGGSSKPKTLADVLKEFETMDKLNKYAPGADRSMLGQVSPDKIFEMWVNASTNPDERSQALAQQLEGLLAGQ